jgi:hypothetical protein
MLDLKYPDEPDRTPNIILNFTNHGLYPFSQLYNIQPGTLKPLTNVQLRSILQYSGLVKNSELQQPWDTTSFNTKELRGLIYLLLEKVLEPEFYRGVFIPYGTIQQISYLVMYRTTTLIYQCIRNKYEHHPESSSHFCVWVMMNIASFQRTAMYDLARQPMQFDLFMNHIVQAYNSDCINHFPAFKQPREPLDEQVIIGRALCKQFLFEHKIGNLTREPLYQLPAHILTNMITIQHIYVLNRHRCTPSLMRVNDSRLINNLSRDIEHLIPFWSIINKYCPDSTARNFHAMIFDARYIGIFDTCSYIQEIQRF